MGTIVNPDNSAFQVALISESTIAELREYYPDIISRDAVSLPETLSQINTMTGSSKGK